MTMPVSEANRNAYPIIVSNLLDMENQESIYPINDDLLPRSTPLSDGLSLDVVNDPPTLTTNNKHSNQAETPFISDIAQPSADENIAMEGNSYGNGKLDSESEQFIFLTNHDDDLLPRKRNIDDLLPEKHISLSFWEKIGDVSRTANEDYRLTDAAGKAIIIGFIAMLAYEWGPGNETVTPILAGRVLDNTDGLSGIALTSLVAGGSVMLQQLTSGYLARKTASKFPKVSEKTFKYLNEDVSDEDTELRFKPFDQLPKTRKLMYGMFLGSSFTVTREAMVNNTADEEQLSKINKVSALMASIGTLAIAGMVDIADQVFPDNDPVQMGVDILKNPWLWVAFGIGVVGKDALVTKIKNLKGN